MKYILSESHVQWNSEYNFPGRLHDLKRGTQKIGNHSMIRHLIIGGGPAAINAIGTIRDFDGGTNPITLVSDEPAYSRMVLPYYLADQIPEKQVYTADDAYYDSLKVERRIGSRVRKIDPQAKSITLQDGQRLAFDDLLIATGASPT